MRIDKIEVENYGVLDSSHTFDLSTNDLALIYGANEAGKSTLLSFVRDVLFGRSNDSSPLFSLSGTNELGGRLAFTLRNGRSGWIERFWLRDDKKKSQFRAVLDPTSDSPSEELDAQGFSSLLNDADRSLFSNYFGFSRKELVEGGEALKDAELHKLIYGMAFGGVVRYQKALDALEGVVSKHYKTRWLGDTKKALDELVKARACRNGAGNSDAYGKALAERDELTSQREVFVNERKALEPGLERIKRLQSVWTRYHDLVYVESEVDRLIEQTSFDADALRDFSPECETRYKSATEERDNLVARAEAARREVDRRLQEIRLLENDVHSSFLRYADELERAGKYAAVAKTFRLKEPERVADLHEQESRLIRDLSELGLIPVKPKERDLELRREPILLADVDVAKELAEEEKNATESLKKARFARESTMTAKEADVRRSQEARDEFDSLGGDSIDDDAFEDALNQNALFSKKLAALTANVENLNKGRAELEQSADILARRASDFSRKDDAIKEECENGSFTFGRLVAPSRKEFDSLRQERDSERERLDALRREIDEREKKRAKLLREIAKLSRVGVSSEELRGAREKRDRFWSEIEAFWLDPKVAAERFGRSFDSVVARTELLEQARDAIIAADSLADRRFERAEEAGKLANFEDELAALGDDSDLLNESREREGRLATFNARLVEYWNRANLSICADLSFEASDEWLSAFEQFCVKRDEFELDASALSVKIAEAEEELNDLFQRVVANSVSPEANVEEWNEVSDSLDDFSRLRALDAIVSDLFKRGVKKAKKRESLRKVIADAEDARCRRVREIERLDKEIADDLARLKDVDERRMALLKKYALNASSVPTSVALVELFDRWRDVQQDDARLRKEKEALARDQEVYETFDASTTELSRKLNVPRKGAPEEDVDAWLTILKDVKTKQTELVRAQSERDAATRELKATQTERERLLGAMETIEKAARVPREEIGAFMQTANELRKLTARRRACREQLRAALGVCDDDLCFEATIDELRNTELEELDDRVREQEERIAEFDRRRDSLNKRLGELAEQIKNFEAQDDALLRRTEYERDVIVARDALEEYAPAYIAYNALCRAKEECDREVVPRVVELATAIFCNATDYHKIEATKDGEYRVCDLDRPFKKPDQLSEGTRETLYLALRLARVAHYCENAEPLPVFADDILVNCDDERVEKILSALLQYVAPERQIVLQTHHQSTRDAFERATQSRAIVLRSNR